MLGRGDSRAVVDIQKSTVAFARKHVLRLVRDNGFKILRRHRAFLLGPRYQFRVWKGPKRCDRRRGETYRMSIKCRIRRRSTSPSSVYGVYTEWFFYRSNSNFFGRFRVLKNKTFFEIWEIYHSIHIGKFSGSTIFLFVWFSSLQVFIKIRKINNFNGIT